MCIYVGAIVLGGQRYWTLPELELKELLGSSLWVIGTKLRSSRRAVCGPSLQPLQMSWQHCMALFVCCLWLIMNSFKYLWLAMHLHISWSWSGCTCDGSNEWQSHILQAVAVSESQPLPELSDSYPLWHIVGFKEVLRCMEAKVNSLMD